MNVHVWTYVYGSLSIQVGCVCVCDGGPGGIVPGWRLEGENERSVHISMLSGKVRLCVCVCVCVCTCTCMCMNECVG